MERGTVKWFDARKGYGFVTNLNGKDVFVHYTNIQMDGFRLLHEGDIVSFETVTDKNNRIQAANVKPILTLNIVKEALQKENLHLSKKKDAYGNTVWLVVDENNVIQAGEQGMFLEELAEYAGLNIEGMED